MKLSHKASEAPDVDGEMVLGAKDNFGSAVESRLDIKEIGLVDEHTGSKVDDFDSHL
jgi:hypothetical protein